MPTKRKPASRSSPRGASAGRPKPPRPRDPALLARLRGHFKKDPGQLPVVEQGFDAYERPNLHMAVEELLGAEGRPHRLVGVVLSEDYHTVSLSKMARAKTCREYDEGPVQYLDVDLAEGRKLACVKRGLYLFHDGGRETRPGESGEPAALLVAEKAHSYPPQVLAAVMAGDRDRAERILRRLTRATRLGKAFRGNVLSLEQDCSRQLTVQFHHLPKIEREAVILPEPLLSRIERHTVSFTRHAERLKAAGRHLKRGILLHGPPGTGKTLSAMYLAGRMPGRTVLLLTGGGMGSIETACRLARLLEPATIIVEDADLIGTERGQQTVGANALLFELLNQMDGLAEDADVLFILTTNRPQLLEPALAARPGRIDQAIEVPPPDADCRRRLLELYGRGLDLRLEDREALVRRTEGVSGAFIRELLRKAAVFAAEEDGEAGDGGEAGGGALVVRHRHVDEALSELLVSGGLLTRSLLGASADAVGGD